MYHLGTNFLAFNGLVRILLSFNDFCTANSSLLFHLSRILEVVKSKPSAQLAEIILSKKNKPKLSQDWTSICFSQSKCRRNETT